MMRGDELVSVARDGLGSDATTLSVSDARARLKRARQLERTILLDQLKREVAMRAEMESEDQRALLARLLAAFLPDSLPLVDVVLSDPHTTGAIGELQFSLFVALSDIGGDADYLDVREPITAYMKRYLLAIEDDAAQAAWMAADALGDHWPLDAGLQILLEAAEGALHPAGREASLHGLSHALARATKRQQWEIVEVLRRLEAGDSSESVRRYAEAIQGEIRGL